MGKSLDRKELGPGISQRKDGLYMGRFVDQYQKRHTLYDRDLKTLKRRLEKEKYEADHLFVANGKLTVTEWIDEFIQLYKVNRVKETTLYRITQTFAPCKKASLGKMRLIDVRAIHVQHLINELYESGYAWSTLNLLKAQLKELFKVAMGNGLMMLNPCEAVILPKKPRQEARFLSPEEQALFLEASAEYQHHTIFLAALSCGLRIGELLGLKWDDINWDEKTLRVERTLHYKRLKDDESCHFFFTSPKTESSERIIPLLPETERVLKYVRKKQLANKLLAGDKWKQEDPFVDMVFTTQQGAPVRYGDVNRTIKLVVTKANLQEEEIAKYENREPVVLKPFSPHCFRHTFITNCKRNKIPYDVIKPYVGHSAVTSTMMYDHYEPQIDVSELKKISFLGVV